LLLIFAWFFVPLAIAAIWYALVPDGWHSGSMTNNGKLLDPIFTLEPFEQRTLDGQAFSGKDLEKVWTFVHLVDGECGEACSHMLYNTRQIRVAQGKNMNRVERVTVVGEDARSASNAKMWESHPDMVFVVASQGGLGEQIRQHTAKDNFPANSFFLVDPLGNVMMQFSPDLPPKKVSKDLKKLLKLSHIG
jgi:cytochrome oxidase Cu insertion factor (SCO1/SenC/PrrC family)